MCPGGLTGNRSAPLSLRSRLHGSPARDLSMQSPTGLTRYILTIHEANPRRPTAAHCNSVKSTADLPLQLGEAFYRGAAAWIKSDMWTAKRFLIHDELRKRLTVEDYDGKDFCLPLRRDGAKANWSAADIHLESLSSIHQVVDVGICRARVACAFRIEKKDRRWDGLGSLLAFELSINRDMSEGIWRVVDPESESSSVQGVANTLRLINTEPGAAFAAGRRHRKA